MSSGSSYVHKRFYKPFFILVIYAPANLTRERREFFERPLQFQQLDPYDDRSCVDRLVIAGDFNFTIQSSQSSSSYRNWIQLLSSHFQNVMSDLRDLHTPTFRRGAVTRSTVDYLSTTLSANYIDATVDFVDLEWSDHAILAVELKLDLADSHGPGAWRANPIYLGHKDFRRRLANMLTELYHSEIAHSRSSQILWDVVKARVKEFTRKYGRSYVSWRSQQIKRLQKKCHRILQSSLPEGILVEHLPRVERQIAFLQHELVEIKALKAEKTWREHGGTEAGYLKKSASVRSAQRSILQL
ncbi:uncharacterized protein RHIMIDRAFT_129447 [Rhizopus microsporus ATCC 52813]|uniref:Endonuclease/exonuclease/phosphatase domain-containing protein n=1 Tax=Rhizopus microsporus ATCC 52813 TaxID=1340429 RepID=A0A2G4SWN0_RHIZD|nr:uncharacterized protein RHIMIDRAFT_129447 [Rhizopus microsporus ATCC 52813]PHZ13154.1 hypothetical protein RHIMIDRAFT_129447 [Rhizopus microsporus ATCC 52813]